ncbi:MAG TPA: isoamylase early set domain-containing protein [Gemmatimonadaceae bacterium]|nr:isoamylase early set domain-containing protein [Gemmatimonadaceae bacterium]
MDPLVQRIVQEARRPVAPDPAAKARLMAAIHAEARPRQSPRRRRWRWLLEPRPLALSPLGGFAVAAGLVGIGIATELVRTYRDGHTTGEPRVLVAAAPLLPVHDTVTKFVLVAPHATRVSLVGDFNDWNASATPMQRTPTGGTWSVTVHLAPGRHVYAFEVAGSNGTQWVADPSAPLAPEDGFGAPNSVVLVGGSAS